MNTTIPTHVGLILDGNRRWAKKRGLPTFAGHKAGYEKIKDIAEHLFNSGVTHVSMYIFSTENWNRSKDEVDYLMRLLPTVFNKYIQFFEENEIRIHWLGTQDKLTPKQLDIINRALTRTVEFQDRHLSFCFNYGGQTELRDAVRAIVRDSSLESDDITEETIAQHLYEPAIPPVDLVIRTSGEQRLSGFMLWRASYAELLFLEKYWPDMQTADIDDALAEYASRKRRFGC